MRKYLYITLDGDVSQSDCPPRAADIQNVVEGDLTVYRYDNNEFQQLTPIDNEDADNWTRVDEEF